MKIKAESKTNGKNVGALIKIAPSAIQLLLFSRTFPRSFMCAQVPPKI